MIVSKKSGEGIGVYDMEVSEMPGLFENFELSGKKYKVVERMWDWAPHGAVAVRFCHFRVIDA